MERSVMERSIVPNDKTPRARLPGSRQKGQRQNAGILPLRQAQGQNDDWVGGIGLGCWGDEGLPEFDAVAFRVDDPGEAAVVGVFAFGVDGDACGG